MRQTLLALLLLIGCARPRTLPPEGTEVLGTFKGGEILKQEVEARALSSLQALRQETYNVKAQATEELVFERLLVAEAQRVGLHPDDLLKQEVDDRIPEPTPEAYQLARKEIRQARQLPKDEAQARAEVLSIMLMQAKEKRFLEYRAGLLERNGFRLLLEPPRFHVPPRSHSPARGPADAPITLVEFSSFQCKHCKDALDTMTALWEIYQGQVRHIVRNMPVEEGGGGNKSTLAAQAALWTQSKGRFWPYRTILHHAQEPISEALLVAKATELELDGTDLAACLQSGRHEAEVRQDVEDASLLGLDGAPAFLVNGRFFRGLPPLSVFAQVFNDELRRAGQPVTPEQQAAALATSPFTAGH